MTCLDESDVASSGFCSTSNTRSISVKKCTCPELIDQKNLSFSESLTDVFKAYTTRHGDKWLELVDHLASNKPNEAKHVSKMHCKTFIHLSFKETYAICQRCFSSPIFLSLFILHIVVNALSMCQFSKNSLPKPMTF